MSTINVPADFSTISLAVAGANPGDTIIVASGVYNEQVTINKANLSILGAQANIDARTRPFVPGNESIITFAPGFGAGIVNILSPDVVINGFTIQGAGPIMNSRSAIYSGDLGTFLPSTSTIDVTGLQIIYNKIQNNANGVLIASIEPTLKISNYLVQYNFLQNNSGDPNSGNGQGVFFNNSAGTQMTNILVTENLFNGLETNSSVNLANVSAGTVSNNVMNQDNSIAIFGSTDVSITGNVIFGATGITPDFPTNTASAIFIGFGSSNITIDRNLIFNATNNGISLFDNNSNIIITNNCIENNTNAGIVLSNGSTLADSFGITFYRSIHEILNSPESNVLINGNNIEMNNPGLLLNPGSYSGETFDATQNYWNSPSGPNYNGSGPGTGDTITDNNIPDVQTVIFIPFLTNPIICPSPVILSKSSPSINIPPTAPVSFNISFTVQTNGAIFTLNSFSDFLPPLASDSVWTISAQNPPGFFTLIGPVGIQELTVTSILPLILSPGIYSVTVSANTSILDAGEILNNTATMEIQFGGETGLIQDIMSSASASIAICIHGSSMIKLADGKEIQISKLVPGTQILGADGQISTIIEAVPCWAGAFGNCIIFEPNSLGSGIPSSRFAIDAGHPMCILEEYNKWGNKSLRSAKYFSTSDHEGIFGVTWDMVESLLPGENRRYDIIMNDESCKAYIANGIVVQARKNRKESGYSYD